MRDSLIGQRLERYEVIELLGEGGMGAVYCARDTVLDRDVALKVMHPQYARKPEFQQRFLNEARVAAQLDHPGIVKVHDYRQDGDYLYIVMEYIAGGNLSQMLQNLRAKQQWLSIREAVQLVRQVGLALDYAHRKGVLHRDIKPANIMIKPEPAGELPYQPVITDLGLARLGEGLGLTQTGISMGTPSYMSPEQAAGKPTDVRSDVYSLGILLYELAVGQLPFKANTISEAITFHTTQPPPPPRSLRPDISQPLEQAILRALQKDPSARYASAAALVQALDALPPATLGPTMPAGQGTGGAAPPKRAGSAPTQVEPGAPALRGLSVLEQFAPAASGPAQLQLLSPDGKVKSLALEPGVMTIGRSPDNTLPVNDPKVSQQHLRLEYDGSRCRVTDQNSTNGTYMGTVKLLAGVAQLWDAQTPLRIGDHYLRLATATSKTSVGTATDGMTVLGALQGQAGAEPPAVLQVEAGGQVSTSVMLHNQTNLVDALALQVEGIPSTWVKLPPPANLYPQDQQAVTVTFQPPRSSESTAKNYDVRLSVYSRNANAVTPHSTLKVQVMPFRQVQSRLTQQTLRERQAAGVVLENLGNAPQRFQVRWSDPANELQFDPSQAETVVEPGKSVTSSFQVRVKQKRWLGGIKPHPLTAQVSADGGGTQEFTATLQSRGLFPAWLPIFLLLLLTALGALLVQQIGKSQTDAERNAANMRATETAIALAADVDGDGLSAAKEAELGTDPNKADTDEDGLKDGDEVRQGTNPQVVDTDGDTLPDGSEVANGTSPVKSDTDSDGTSDNVDPAPKQLPTSTPTPNFTATAEVYAQQTTAAVQATQRAEQAIVATQQAVAAAAAQATAAAAQATAAAEAAIAATATAEWLIDNPQIQVGVDRTVNHRRRVRKSVLADSQCVCCVPQRDGGRSGGQQHRLPTCYDQLPVADCKVQREYRNPRRDGYCATTARNRRRDG